MDLDLLGFGFFLFIHFNPHFEIIKICPDPFLFTPESDSEQDYAKWLYVVGFYHVTFVAMDMGC